MSDQWWPLANRHRGWVKVDLNAHVKSGEPRNQDIKKKKAAPKEEWSVVLQATKRLVTWRMSGGCTHASMALHQLQ